MLCSDDQYLAILIREAKSWSPGRTYFLKLKLEEIKEGKKKKAMVFSDASAAT